MEQLINELPIVDENLIQLTEPTADICSSVSNATALSDDCQNASAQPLEDILLWPSSPVRKGKRKTERLPFKEKKETELKQKEERKILRQLNKEAKEIATNNKGVSKKKGLKRKVELISSIVVRPPDSGQSVWADDSDCSDPHCKHTLKHGICFTCTFGISKSLCGVKCTKCARSYHIKCLEKYLVKLDEDPFICKRSQALQQYRDYDNLSPNISPVSTASYERPRKCTTGIPQKTKLRFREEDDLIFLREVLGYNPFQQPDLWYVIQEHVYAATRKLFSVKTLKDYLDLLIKIWIEKTKNYKDRSGIEEEYCEKDKLLAYMT
nr:unnamed protein product [Callosobruchus analis]